MAGAATPARRQGAAASSSSVVPPFSHRRRFSLAGACSSHQASNLPSVCLAAVSHGRRPAPTSGGGARRACACSPTAHPGSFRCALHRGVAHQSAASAASTSSSLHARRSAMANSLVRIAAVEGADHVRRALAALIRPSSHHQRRRAAFRPRPSRLSAMSTAAANDDPAP